MSGTKFLFKNRAGLILDELVLILVQDTDSELQVSIYGCHPSMYMFLSLGRILVLIRAVKRDRTIMFSLFFWYREWGESVTVLEFSRLEGCCVGLNQVSVYVFDS